MDQGFTNAGEFRTGGKSNRKSRLAPRARFDHSEKKGQKQTPNKIAIKQLENSLKKLPRQKDKYPYIEIFRDDEQVRFINMGTMAEVIVYMETTLGNNEINENNFNYDTIAPFIENLLPRSEVMEQGIKTKEIGAEELEVMRLRMAATFLRYIKYIMNLRQKSSQSF